jgi:hypothetical protein
MMKMKPTFLIALMVFGIVSSCSRKSSITYSEPNATFKFNVYGGEMLWDGGELPAVCSSCGPKIIYSGNSFNLRSSEPDNPSHYLLFTMNSLPALKTFSDTLKTPTSFTNAAGKLVTDFFEAAATEPGDYASITFTSIREGKYFDGFFNARLTFAPNSASSGKLAIQNGEFHNVKMY